MNGLQVIPAGLAHSAGSLIAWQDFPLTLNSVQWWRLLHFNGLHLVPPLSGTSFIILSQLFDLFKPAVFHLENGCIAVLTQRVAEMNEFLGAVPDQCSVSVSYYFVCVVTPNCLKECTTLVLTPKIQEVRILQKYEKNKWMELFYPRKISTFFPHILPWPEIFKKKMIILSVPSS